MPQTPEQTASAHLEVAIASFEAGRDGQAAGSLRAALKALEPTAREGVVSMLNAALKAFNQGNDAHAADFARTALERLHA